MKNTYIRISAFMLAAGMVFIPSCSRKGPETSPVSSSVETTANVATAPAETPPVQTTEGSQPEPVFASSEQLGVIIAAKNQWFVEGDAQMKYAITDLDMNGRYEITAAKKNSYFAMYEVNADKSGVTKVTTTFEAGTPGPYMEEEYNLRVNSDGEYLYVAREYEDSLNEGETTIYYYVLSLKDGHLRANQIATEIRNVDADGNENVRYGDDEYEMSEAEFKAKTDKDLPAIQYTQKVVWGDGNSVAGINDAKALEGICFKLTK